jgi:CRP-like cAMP-binding protein
VISRLIRKLERRDVLSDEEKQVLAGAVARVKEIRMDEDLVRDGDRPTESTLLLEGIAARYKLLRNGRRQITALHISGDFVDLHSFLLKTMDHGVVALTRCRVGLVPHSTLRIARPSGWRARRSGSDDGLSRHNNDCRAATEMQALC